MGALKLRIDDEDFSRREATLYVRIKDANKQLIEFLAGEKGTSESKIVDAILDKAAEQADNFTPKERTVAQRPRRKTKTKRKVSKPKRARKKR